MKIGDLIRYKDSLSGMNGRFVGLIVATNGKSFDVQWTGRVHSRLTVELPEFIEKIEIET